VRLFLVVLRALIFMISIQEQENSRRCWKKQVLFNFYQNSLVKFF